MAPFLPVRATSRSQAVRIGGTKLSTTTTTYVDLNPEAHSKPYAYSPLKELKSHLAIGAVITVGGITNSNSDWAVASGLVTSATTAAEPEVSTTAGEIRQRSTGKNVVSTGFTAAKKKVTAAGKERVDIISVNQTTGATKYDAGTAALVGAAAPPATPAGTLLVAEIVFTEAEATTIRNVNRA